MKTDIKTFGTLHIILMLYSVSAVFSKLAARQPFLSIRFCVCYLAVLALLFLYAVGWQQIIKKLPLTTAFASKAVTVVWGIIWGALFFHETITIGKLAGTILIITGIIIYSNAEGDIPHE